VNIETVGMTALLGTCAGVPALASTGDTLTEETRSLAVQTALQTAQGRVVSVDAATQTMNVMGPEGNTIRAPLVHLANGSALSQGDAVAVEYRAAMSIAVETAAEGDQGVRERVDLHTIVPMGQGYAVAHQTEISGTIERIDARTRELTLRGVHGERTVAAPPQVDLAQLEHGDRAHVVVVTDYSLQPVLA
jgi:hypothetical protein